MRDIPYIRDTGLRVLENYREKLASNCNTLVLAGVRPDVATVLARTGEAERLGRDNIFTAKPEITATLDDAWHHAKRISGAER